MIAIIMVVLAAAAGAVTDLRTRRIPDAVPATLVVAGLAFSAMHGWQSLGVSAILLVAVFLLGTLLFSLHLVGGGDVKLIAAASATLGWPQTGPFLLYTIFAGALLGTGIALTQGRLRATVANICAIATPMVAGGRPAAITPAVGTMPYGVAIFVGAVTLALTNALGFNWSLL